MILTLYDKDHNKIRPLYDIKDYHIDSVLSTGDKTLSFIMPGSQLRDISNESYVRDKDEFVIKSITPASEGWYQIQCNLNVEALESYIEKFETVEKTMKECLDYAFVGTGWRVGVCEITKRRTLRRTNTTPWQILQDARKTYRAEIAINSIDKVIDIYSHIGADKGVYFAEQLNLKDLKKQSTSFNFYTQILPKGKDNLTIESVNDGKDTLSDFSYSTKVKTFLWIDQRYTVAESLKEDAQYKLNEMSKPVIAYTVSVIDLAKMSDVYKDILDFRLGDTVTLLHKSSNTSTKTRIVKITVYPNEPNRNTCDVANSILTLEDIQQDLQDAADTVSNVTTNNGELDGSKVNNITTNQISDFSAKVGEITDLTAIKASITDLYATRATIQDLQAVNARIGTLEATSITTTIFNAELAKINQAIIGKADITDLNAASGKINVLESQVSTITTLIGGSATVGDIHTIVLNAENTTIANALIKSAMIDSVTANKITAGVIDASSIHFKSKSGNMDLFDNTLLIKDATRPRVQIGKDAAGDYNIYVWDKVGNLMFDATGVTADGIQKPIIRNDMVSPNANIDGSKINITSLVTEINGSTTKINSSHVLYDGKSLDVAFNEMQTTVEGNNTTIGNLSTQLTVQQGKIATLITDTSQTKQDLTDTKGTVTTLQTNYSSLQQTVTGLSTTVGQHTSSITKVSNDLDNLQISGRNLIKKSSFDTFDKTYWTVAANSIVTTGIADPYGGKRALHFKAAQANSFILLARGRQVFPYTGIYSLSIWLRGNKTGKVDVTLNSSAPHPTGKYITCNVTTTWQKFTLTCNVDNLSLLYDFVIGGYNSWVDLTLELDIAYPMLVTGNKPTDWIPAPEDTNADIKAVSDKQTTFEATLDGINGKVSSIESTTTTNTNDIKSLATTVNETKTSVSSLKLDYDGFKVNVSNTYASKSSLNDIDIRMSTAEQKITAEAIVSTVTSSYEWIGLPDSVQQSMMGTAKSLPNNIDLDTYITPGIWTTSGLMGAIHTPPEFQSNSEVRLVVEYIGNSLYVQQTLIATYSGNPKGMWKRSKGYSSWYSWEKIANTGNIVSCINQTAETIKIQASKIQLEGTVTANSYFKINLNGSMEATSGKIAGWDINYNSISSSYVELNHSGVSLYDGILSSSNLRSTMDENGMHYYRDGYYLGKIGTNKLNSDNSKKGIVFDLEDRAAYMTWACADYPGGDYMTKFTYCNNAMPGFSRSDCLYMGTQMHTNNFPIHLSDDIHSVSYNDGGGFCTSGLNKKFYVSGGNDQAIAAFFLNESGQSWTKYFGNINMNGYSIINQSDIRLKTNIAPTSVKALDAITKFDFKKYNWIIDGRNEDIGLIAQQIKLIAPNLVTEEGGLLGINLQGLIMYALKGIQELKDEVDSNSSGTSNLPSFSITPIPHLVLKSDPQDYPLAEKQAIVDAQRRLQYPQKIWPIPTKLN